MLHPTVDKDDDENDHSDEYYAVSSESELDDNNDVEEEELQTPVNPIIKNAVTQCRVANGSAASAQLLLPEFKRTCNATVGLYGQSSNPQNEAIGTKFRHLVVNISQTPYERSITKQLHSYIIGQNRLQTLGAPTRPIGPHPPRSTPLFKWIHSPESESSTPSKEALVQGTSHVQCNPLTLPNTRS
ncbi:hypothetical protein M9H77_31992 [Catharanthus roseus]|uniref:Uncharacterized protein n=1 Tax=Catharanthus roseus TaxID=4058 RepID=A0ACC0A1L3_CATRO|nr:hypothetical protein M9H77_31992 [Catharanthus roseus]